MGIFDRENSGTATMERPKTETQNRTETNAPTQGTNQPSNRTATTTATGVQTGTTTGTATSRKRTSMTLTVRWTNTEGEVFSECAQTLTPNGKAMGTLHLTKPEGWPAGQYRMEVYLNDACAASMDFEFK